MSKSLSDRKKAGAHYTPAQLAKFVAEQLLNHLKPVDGCLRILDPAVGDAVIEIGREVAI